MDIPLTRRSLMALPAVAVASAQGTAPDRASRLIGEWRETLRAPAFCAAVWKAGTIVWSQSIGRVDLENAVDASARSRFRIGSVSKLVTAAAAARLYDEGALDLDAPIQQYVPPFPAKDGKITARLLLGHLAGIRHYGGAEYLNRQRYSSVGETLKNIAADPLLHTPGSKYFYSSYGFNLLGAALEGAAKQEYRAIVQTRVARPLGLASLAADENQKVMAGRVRFYSVSGETVENSPYTDLSDRWPSGGLLASAEDLARFGGAHLTGGFLKPETRRAMFTSQRTEDGRETGTGWAWRVGSISGRAIWHHGGDAIGGRAFVLLRPDDGVAVAMTANLSLAKFAEAQAFELAGLFV